MLCNLFSARHKVLYRMGDRSISRKGRITITERSDDMLKVSGVLVYLSEVSRALLYFFSAHVSCVLRTDCRFCGPESSFQRLCSRSVLRTSTSSKMPSARLDDRQMLSVIQRHVNLSSVSFIFECGVSQSSRRSRTPETSNDKHFVASQTLRSAVTAKSSRVNRVEGNR